MLRFDFSNIYGNWTISPHFQWQNIPIFFPRPGPTNHGYASAGTRWWPWHWEGCFGGSNTREKMVTLMWDTWCLCCSALIESISSYWLLLECSNHDQGSLHLSDSWHHTFNEALTWYLGVISLWCPFCLVAGSQMNTRKLEQHHLQVNVWSSGYTKPKQKANSLEDVLLVLVASHLLMESNTCGIIFSWLDPIPGTLRQLRLVAKRRRMPDVFEVARHKGNFHHCGWTKST